MEIEIYAAITLLALIPSVGYAIRYHFVTKGGWRKHVVGRALMFKAVINAVLVGFITFNTFYMAISGHSYSARVYIGMGLFAVFAAALWYLWIAFERSQKEK